MPPPPSHLADGALSFSTGPFPAVPSLIHFHPPFEAQYTRHPKEWRSLGAGPHPTPHMALGSTRYTWGWQCSSRASHGIKAIAPPLDDATGTGMFKFHWGGFVTSV